MELTSGAASHDGLQSVPPNGWPSQCCCATLLVEKWYQTRFQKHHIEVWGNITVGQMGDNYKTK